MKLREIQERYKINSSNLEEIKSQLKAKIKESHPDNNNDYDRDYFIKLNKDLAYVEGLIKIYGNLRI